MKKEKVEHVDKNTGEVTEGKLNQVITNVILRKNGTRRIQQDFKYCPSLAEQHSAQMTDVNYLIEKFTPDALDAYLAQREQNRPMITNHDFTNEPDMQEGLNVVYRSRQTFEKLPEMLKKQFLNHVEFLKFIDNPENQRKMKELKLMNQKQIDDVIIPDRRVNPNLDDKGVVKPQGT